MKLITIFSILLTLILLQIFHFFKLNPTSAFIFLGQAHFFLAYYYKIKHQSLPPSKYITYLIFGILLFGSYLLFNYNHLLEIATSLYFVVHFVLDVFYLNRFKGTVLTFFRTSLPLLLVYVGIQDLGEFSNWTLLYMVPLSLLLFFIVKKEERWYFVVFTIFAMLVYFFAILEILNVQLEYVSSLSNNGMPFIILSHYILWYLYYIQNPRSKEFMKVYLKDVFIVNFFVGVLFFIYIATNNSVLNLFFSLENFLLWTWMHYIWTLRKEDINWKGIIWTN